MLAAQKLLPRPRRGMTVFLCFDPLATAENNPLLNSESQVFWRRGCSSAGDD